MPINDDWAAAVTVVDDEPWMVDVLVRAARSWNYRCQAATSAEQALALLEQQPTPVVVTDLRMPGRGGLWLVRETQRRWPEIHVIVVTAGQDSDAAIACLNAGAQRYFLKPINLDEFRHALAMTLRTYRLEREREQYRQQLEQQVRRQTHQLRQTYLSAIDSLVRTLEARDPYTTGHSLRVRRYSLRLAKVLGLDRQQVQQLSLAAKLHDIGKVGIPEVILNKPSRLTQDEFCQIREHPIIGERILSPIIRNPAILAAIRGHHERLDGSGYPDGLHGSRLPVLARILAISDCFDALTSSRAYRDALPVFQALDILRAGAGTQFDPEFVRAFLDVAMEALPCEANPCRSVTEPAVARRASGAPRNEMETTPSDTCPASACARDH
jgi:putative two-component system response regulator